MSQDLCEPSLEAVGYAAPEVYTTQCGATSACTGLLAPA